MDVLEAIKAIKEKKIYFFYELYDPKYPQGEINLMEHFGIQIIDVQQVGNKFWKISASGTVEQIMREALDEGYEWEETLSEIVSQLEQQKEIQIKKALNIE